MGSSPPAYDGHEALIGVYGGTPSMVPRFYAHQALNRFYRGDENLTRPTIREIPITFATEADRIWFAGGNGQGAFFYNRYPATSAPELIVSIAGKIFAITVQGRSATARVIYTGNSITFTHAWFAQGFEWLAIQDGIHAPLFYNGTIVRRSNLGQQEMPVGSVMAFIHGRFVVASADGKNIIRVGEIVYANTNANTNDILKFPNVIPSFDIATNLGDVMGLQPMPFLDTGSATNELVALCQNGFTSFDFNRDEAAFLTDPPIQRISLVGEGCVSSHGFATLNGDVFYRRSDGIGSYRNARVEYSQSWSQTPISRAVDHWIQYDRGDLLQYIPMVSWQNMVFTGCSPLLAPPNNPCSGYHRFCRGFTVFDAQSMSTASRDGTPVWHGMWTGIRPWALIKGRIDTAQRCFSFSYDRDGKNRLYEITLDQGDDVFGREPRKIYSRYDTPSLGSVEGRSSMFGIKRLTGGVIELNEVLGETSLTISHRPDGAPCLVPIMSATTGCDCPTFTCGVNSQPGFGRLYFPNIPDSACVPGTTQPGNVFHHTQIRVEGEGSFRVDRLNIRFDVEQSAQLPKCSGVSCTPIDCCPEINDYSYHIAPSGTNTEIPAIDCPTPEPPLYTSTRYFTAVCPGDPTQFVTASGQATSTISQLDADNKALAAAQATAQAQLVCYNCAPETIYDFSINGGDEDLSPYFGEGIFAAYIGQPWRLYDVIVLQYIATGIVDGSGTLVTTSTFGDYTHGSFDSATNIYTDSGGGSTTIALQLGCNIGGKYTWPDPDPYLSP